MSRIDNIINSARNSGTEKKKSRVDSIIENSSNGNLQTGVDEKYINSFIKDATDLFSNLGDVGYNNASSYYDDYTSKSRELGDRADTIKAYLNSNKSNIDEKTYTDFMGYLNKLERSRSDASRQLRDTAKYYSQWESEDDYNAYVENVKKQESDYQAMLDYDSVAGQEEIRLLESDLDAIYKVQREIANIDSDNERLNLAKAKGSKDAIASIEANNERKAILEKSLSDAYEKYGGAEGLKSLISEKRAYHTQAGRTQKAVELASVVNNEDFQKYSLPSDDIKEMSFADKLTGRDYDSVGYLRNNPDALEVYEEAAKGQGGSVERRLLDDINYKAAKYMEDNEYQIYTYYYNKDKEEGTAKAEEFLKSIEESLNLRIANEKFADLEDKTFKELLFGIEAGLDQFETGIESLFSNEDYIPASATQIASGMVREDLADNGAKLPKWLGGASLGQVAYDSITTTSNMLPSIMVSFVPVVGQAAGAVTLGASAAGHAKAEMLNLGYSKSQANLYGVMVGASEAGLQYLLGGISKLGGKASKGLTELALSKVDNALARAAITLGVGMASEGLEEALQTVIEPWLKSLVTGVDFESPNIDEVLYSGLLGAISSLFLEGGTTIAGEANVRNQGANLKAKGAENVNKLADLGKSFTEGTTANRLGNKVNENSSAYTIGRLLTEVGGSLSETNMADISSQLQANGMSPEAANDTAKWLYKAVEGGYFNKRQQKAYESDNRIVNVHRDLFTNEENSVNKRNAEYEALYALAQETTKAKAKTETKVEEAKTETTPTEAPTAVLSNEEIAKKVDAVEGSFNVSNTGKAKIGDTEVTIKEIASIKDGKMMLRLEDDSTVNMSDVDYSSSDEALLYETALNLGMSTATANAFVNGYDGKMSADKYALAFGDAYRYGAYNIPAREMTQGYASLLTEADKVLAYKLGANDMKYSLEAKETKKIASTNAIKSKNNAQKTNKKGKVHYEGGVLTKKLTERQAVSLKAIERLANALGIDFYIYESKTNAEGQHIGSNGWYDPKDGSIHIDLYAGERGEGTMLFTVAHELTHRIRDKFPTKFKVFADFLLENYGEKGVSVESLIKERIEKLEQNGRTKGLTDEEIYDIAYEEVIADSCEAMLADGNAVSKIAELKAKDKGLWEEIKNFFADLIAKIKSVYEGLNPDSQEGNYVKDILDNFEKLQQMWTELVVEASEVEDTIVETDAASESVAPKNSDRDIDTNSTEYKINTSMTMAEAKRMIETAFKVNNIAEYYEGEYADAEDWLKKAGSSEVEMYIENDYDLQAKYVNSNEDILNEEYSISDVLDAYLEGTLVGKEKPKPKRLDVSRSTKLTDSRFYSPQKIEDAKKTFEIANQRASGKDAIAINRARAEILLFAHNKGAAELLGVTQAELNKKLRSWSNYSASAKNISERINAGVAEENRWTGIENSSYISKAKVTNEDIERLVASVEGDSRGYERKYIARVMLAADTHIDYSKLKFKFASSQEVNNDNKSGGRVLGFYDDTNRIIEVTHDKPNTVAHEMGHYIDAQWGRDLIGSNYSHMFLTTGVNADIVRERYGEQGAQFLKNFKIFINSLSDVNNNRDSYTNDRKEIFARFFAKFVEWTDNIATGNRYYSYESSMYNDKFTQAQYVEFAKLLQEKALLDGSIVSSEANADNNAPTPEAEIMHEIKNTKNGDTVVWIEDDVLKGNKLPTHQAVANYLAQHIGEVYTIIESGQKVYLGKDLPSEYTQSKYTKGLLKRPSILKAKNKALPNLGEMIEIATNRRWSKDKGSGKKDAKYGVYKYDTHFAFPVRDNKGNKVGAKAYDATLIIINSSDGKKYLYDLTEIKENTSISVSLSEREAMPAEAGQKESVSVKTIPQIAKSVKGENENKLYSDRNSYAPTFYSHMGKVIDGIKIDKMGANGVVPYLKGKGVKDEEIKWSGIKAFLEGKKSVTKAELQEFMAGNQLVIETEEDDRWQQDTINLDGGSNYREILFKLPNSDYSNYAMRTHWGEDAKGILVHARIQDFDVDGKKMLFIEKLQSDWHNEGHAKGYESDITTDEKKAYDELKRKINTLKDQQNSISKEKATLDVDYFKRENMSFDEYSAKAVILVEKLEKLSDKIISLDNKRNKISTKLREAAPDAPFRKNYHEYVLKRLLRMATEEGYDSIGWTPAEIQVERWSEEYAEGYRIEYDQDMPSFLKKYGKKWGAKVEKATVNGDTDIWSMDITDSMKDSVLYEGQVMYSDRDTGSFSNRSLLANALESVAQNDIERNKLKQYKDKISLIESEQAKLAEVNGKIKELSFAKGTRDTEGIRKLQFEAKQIANRINTYDRQLLTLEATTALKGVLDREKAMAYKKAEQKGKEALAKARENATKTQRELLTRYQESRKKGVEGRKKTEMRYKIKNVVNDLNSYLLKGTKEKHVPIGLQKVVAEALDAVNMDTVGAEERIAKKREEMRIAASKGNLDKVKQLAKEIDHIEEMGGNLNAKLERLKTAYDSIINSEDPLIANSHDEVISNTIAQVIEVVGDTSIRDMNLYQLEAVYKMYRMLLTSVRGANKAFKAAKNEEISTLANRIIEDLVNQKKLAPYSKKAMDTINQFNWNNLKPIYAFERIGSNTFTDIYNNVRAGEDTWARDMVEAQAFLEEQKKKYNYKKFDFGKKYEFTSSNGHKFSLNLEQIMSLYAYSKRGEQAKHHLRNGGFQFDKLTEVDVKDENGKRTKKYLLKDTTAYKISDALLAEIIGVLDKVEGARGFADSMQEYLSSVMGEKGNEVSLAMYDVKLFGEKNYFPLKVSEDFLARAREQAQGDVKIKNKGFTKALTEKAAKTIVLTPFMDVWAGHVNEMSMYHAFTLPLEDFYRVFNYSTPSVEGMDTISLVSALSGAHREGAVQYIDQLLKDLNGGARSDPREIPYKKAVTNFKKASVMFSLSVVIQQPSAIVRATSLVNARYFVGKKVSKGSIKAKWEEVKKYAPVAIIKDMGQFDVGLGKGSADWLKGNKTWKDKADDVASFAPAMADQLTWISIWNAVKRETLHTHKNLKPNSEEFLQAVGERFTEVIAKTQVYDSTLSRSGNMRSKNVYMNMLTSFLAEPTTSINMLGDALRKGKKGNVKYMFKAMGAVYGSVLLNSALVSLVYAMRDDDEDETYLEKYLSRFTSEMADGVNPLTYIPFVKDIWSAAQGFDIERADMTLISSVLDSMQQLIKVASKDTSEMDEEELAEHHKAINEGILSITENLASLVGLPVKNVRRDFDGIINAIRTISKDTTERDTTWGSIGDAIGEEVKNTIPVWGWLPDEKKEDKLYDAIIKGDDAYVARIEDSYESEKSYTSAIRKALKRNDPRIKEAAIAEINGDVVEKGRTIDEIVGEGNFDENDILSAIKSEVDKMTEDDDASETTASKDISRYDIDDYYISVGKGDTKTANIVKEEIIDTKIANGYTQEEAEKDFASDFRSYVGKAYKDGEISRSDASNMLVKHGGYDSDEAYWKMKEWDYDIEYGEDAKYSKYTDFYDAVKTGKNLKTVITEYTSHGVDVETLAKQITTYYKPLYKEMSPYERASIKGYLLNAYQQLGYNRTKKSKDIDKWLED